MLYWKNKGGILTVVMKEAMNSQYFAIFMLFAAIVEPTLENNRSYSSNGIYKSYPSYLSYDLAITRCQSGHARPQGGESLTG